MRPVFVSGCFDNLGAAQVRFLEEASRLGPLTVFLRDDVSAAALLGHRPRFPFEERRYFLEALRWVAHVEALDQSCPADALPTSPVASLKRLAKDEAPVWAMADELCDIEPLACRAGPGKLEASSRAGLEARVLGGKAVAGLAYTAPPIAEVPAGPSTPGQRRVIVTGSFDWLHTGHVRFFEEAAAYGELTVVVGHDANIRLLKGQGHPLLPQAERLYMVGSIRHVARALISTGSGWLDAEPEIAELRPDCYIVNADGDKGDKRAFCEAKGIEYIVLAREPKPGLPARSSTDLRGF